MAYFRKRKTGVQKGKNTYTRYNRVKYVRGIKQPNNKMGEYARAPTLQKVVSLINQKMSAAIENKKSANFEFDDHIVKWAPSTNPVWYGTGTLYNTMFDISNGAGEFQRLGNKYKLKKWTIKGFIYPSLNANTKLSDCLGNSYQGKVTVFLGKRINGDRITGQLENLFQNGNTTIDPVGAVKEQIYNINDDKYKIYWKRSFNMGLAAPLTSNYDSPATPGGRDPLANLNYNVYANNDLKLHRQFNINVTNYIGKNATIKFNDNNATAFLPAPLEGLSLFAVWAPYVQDLSAEAQINSFYKIWSNATYEYEDA